MTDISEIRLLCLTNCYHHYDLVWIYTVGHVGSCLHLEPLTIKSRRGLESDAKWCNVSQKMSKPLNVWIVCMYSTNTVAMPGACGDYSKILLGIQWGKSLDKSIHAATDFRAINCNRSSETQNFYLNCDLNLPVNLLNLLIVQPYGWILLVFDTEFF